jgi:LPS sulfotransferase NodH/glycosyltransferase involved in cell wall biosynthesis
MDTGEAVAAIRALELDVFVAGAYARDFEPVTAIYAHRLAPLQVWHTAVCPTTSGLSAFDAALTCPATEPEGAQAQYHEPLHEIPAAPCAYAFPPPDRSGRDRLRADLAIGAGQTMLISAAMAHKITDRVLAAWAQVLEAAPEAVLVLAPFAANWSMPADPARFAARLAEAGLPLDRVTICPAMPPARLRALVAAADLMLDSFPYSGATTVCEALSVGTPVVARAGGALRQLTGAGWLRAHGLPDLVAGDDAGYVTLAARLAGSPAAREEAARRAQAAAAADPPPHDDRAAYGAAYSRALWSLAEASGRFPDLGPAPADAPFRPSVTPPAPALALRPARARMLAILASPRTGSTLLCAVLNRTPGILSHFELFHEDMIQYARDTVDDPQALAERNADPAGFLDRVRAEAGAAGIQVIAFKHFAHLDQSVTRCIVEDPDIALIHLSRENLLAQYSSEQIARASGEWARHTDRSGDQRRVRFDAAEFEHFLRYQQRIEMERMNIFAAAGRTPLFVEYARLSDAPTRARIGEHVGVVIPDSARPDIRKQNSTDILSRFDNPRAVEDFLAAWHLTHWVRES